MEESDVVESKAYRLTMPGAFVESVLQHEVRNGEVVVQPNMVSICHADLRYYMGQRKNEVLRKKLPMALFHEGIGRVIDSKDTSLQIGQRVIIVPNISCSLLENTNNKDEKPVQRHPVADNYSEDNVFLGSGYDGIGQDHLVIPAENAIPIPEGVPDEIAVLAELCSVSLHALSHVEGGLHEGKAAVFGDGPVGFLTAAALHHIYGIPKSDLLVFGAITDKLAHFDFATTHLVQEFDFHSQKEVVTVMECTGGKFSESAINQAIDLVEPQGKVTLMGVSEDRVPINTRDVLEKGLTLYGTSRSTAKEFLVLVEAFQKKEYRQTLKKILPRENHIIRNVGDLKTVMDQASLHKDWEKMILSFEW